MLYRRKFLGGLLQIFGGKLANIDFQKYLMLATEMQSKPLYDFTPYKYGCFSFTSYCDKRAMARDRMITQDDCWALSDNDEVDYFSLLTKEDKEIILYTKNKYGRLTGNDLVKLVYEKHPFYTINSEIAEKLIGANKLRENREKYFGQQEKGLFSTGYEGKSVESFINGLIENNIKLLIDVRKNPLSMKYGFSKSQIINNLKHFNISYIHIPELGIESEQRKNLNDISDYERLFEKYETTTLARADKYLWQIKQLSDGYKRIAIMCFEADPQMCHRTRVLRKLVNNKIFDCHTDI
ncbi:MAG: hypothetical protein BWY19_01205 [bacterium ADurb.Bin212]|nr:MAG: hypothetical protein BWY19_01205 [bacterium ADurb.Bin212]